MKDENNNNLEEEGQMENEENGEDEVLDDDYLLQLHQYLQEMKKQRKQAEQDADLLNGRLRVLKDEEQKTLKKIEVTRRKTENKMNQLQAQELKIKWLKKIIEWQL